VVRAALERVDVEEPVACRVDRGGEAVVEDPLHMVGVPGVAGGEQQAPAPLEAGDRGARLVVGAVWRQLEPIAERLVVSAGQGVRAGHGASWWQKEWRITLPLLRRNIALALIISVIGSFLAFNQFYILTEGGPGTSTQPVVMWIYEEAFVQYHLGYATADAVALVVVIGIISAAQFYLLRDDRDRRAGRVGRAGRPGRPGRAER
jgi:hypothetical protein